MMISDNEEDNSSTTSLDVPEAEAKESNKTQPKTINAYVCHICEKEFSCRTTTRWHLKNIHKFENFEDDIWLSKVYKKTVEAKIYECEICQKVFCRTENLIRHKLLHSGDPKPKPYSCTTCLKSFSRSIHLKNHINEVHENLKPFTCSACGKSFGRSQNLKNHIAICSIKGRAKKTTEHAFSCEVCLKEFSTAKAVRDHIYLEHNETREFSCKHCSEKVIGSTEYRKHCKERCIIAKQFLCSECGGRFWKLSDLNNHLRRHTGQKPYKCQHCSKAFLTPGDLYAHERLHRGEKDYLCTECGKAFVTKYKLQTHMRFHTGERPYKCTYCSKGFVGNSDLTKHLRQHTGERSYCDLCEKSYAQGYLLRRHKRKVHGVTEPGGRVLLPNKIETSIPHEEEKCHVCTECSKAFTTKYELQIHMRVHTGERSYKCTLCLKSFTGNSDLTKHLRQHTDIEKGEPVKSYKTQLKAINAYICHICEKEFSCRKNTRRHLKNVHKFYNFEDNIWLSKVYKKTVEAKIYECEICQKIYARREDLLRHQLLHSGD